MSSRSNKMEQQLRKRKSSTGPAEAAAAAGAGDSGSEEAIEPTSGGGGGLDRSNLIGLVIGCVGAAMTLLAYQQTVVSTTQCMGAGLVVLMVALCIKEGFFSF